MWKSRISIVQGDITQQDCEAIVNAANRHLSRGGGVCGAIHAAAGPELERECRSIGGLVTGGATATAAYRLPARHVIHAVGPIWKGGHENEAGLLASCYAESLRLAESLGAESIAFPCISTGIFGFPFERASQVALATMRETLADCPGIRDVRLVCYAAREAEIYAAILDETE